MTFRLGIPCASYRRTLALALVLGVAVLGGCSDDDDDDNGQVPTTTEFSGVFSNGTENGSMGITIQSTSLAPPFGDYLVGAAGRDPITPLHEVTATGTLNPIGGEPIDLTGTYDDETDSLALANPTEGYTFTGVFDTTGSFDAIVGEYDGPDGAGFFGCLAGTSVPTEIYCGTFASKKPGTEGTWDILITGNQVAGIAFPNALSEGDPFAFEGTIETTGTMRDLTAGNEEPGVYTLTITGTLNTKTNTIEGTWTYNDLKAPLSESGNWSGSPCP